MKGAPAAFVLSAGLGTRLAPLTDLLPKPLIPVFHKPLVTFALDALIAAGVGDIALNTHHLPETFPGVFGESPTYRGRPLRFFHEPLLLDTGGGIRNARPALGNEAFLLHNGDILADLPLADLIAAHAASGCLATLLLRPEGSGGKANVRFDPGTSRITDLRGSLAPESGIPVIYTGIAMIDPEIFRWIPTEGRYSVVDSLIEAMRSGLPVAGLLAGEGLWMDLGTPAAYLEAHRILSDPVRRPGYLTGLGGLRGEWPSAVDPSARIDPSATLEGMVSVGPASVIGEGAVISDSVLWPGSVVEAGSRVHGCVVSGRAPVRGIVEGGVA
jgi:NDP-sugar pyrophosphorylase family protein